MTTPPTPRNDYVPALTGLRGVAAIWVVLHHVWASKGYPSITFEMLGTTWNLQFLLSGWLGVDVFFVLSGFVLCSPFFGYVQGSKPFPNMRHYTVRRAARIIPAYYLQLLILAVFAFAGILAIPPDLSNFITHALFIQNLVSLQGENINGSYWSLPVEVHYYLCLPVIFWLFKRYGVARTAATILLGMMCYRIGIIHLLHDKPIALKSLYIDQIAGRIDQFLIGFGCAYLFSIRHTISLLAHRYTPAALCLAGMMGMAGCLTIILNVVGLEAFWGGHPFLYVFRSLLGLCVGMVIMGAALDTGLIRWALSNPLSYFLGTISYGIYLWHFPIHLLLEKYAPSAWLPHGISGAFALALLCTVIAASLSYYLLERPVLNWAQRLTKKS